MTIKTTVRAFATTAAFLCTFAACKARNTTDASATKVAISIPAQRIDKEQIQQLIQMIQDEANGGTKLAGSRGIAVDDTFRFFNLTDDEMTKIKNSRKNPTTVEKFTNKGTTYYLLSSIGDSVKTPVASTGGYTVFFDSTVKLFVEILAKDKLDICRMEGIQIYTYIKWNSLVGFYGDGSPNAEPSQVVSAPSTVYPKTDCIKR